MTYAGWAYILATAKHETANRLVPVREGMVNFDKAARRIAKRMWGLKITRLPYYKPDKITGQVYYGRGFVQLTWAENYKKNRSSDRAG